MVAEGAQDEQARARPPAFGGVLADVAQHVGVVQLPGLVEALGDDGQLLAQRDEAPVVRQDAPVGLLGGHVDLRLVGGPQPGLDVGEAGVLAVVPLHGGAGVVPGLGVDDREGLLGRAAGVDERVEGVARLDVDVVLDAGVQGVGHADLLPHVDVGGAPQQVDGGGQHGGGLVAAAPRVPEAVEGARLVVVVPEQGVPPAAGLQAQRPLVEQPLELGDVGVREGPLAPALVVDLEVVEVEDHRQLLALGAGVAHAGLDGGRGHLPHGHRVRVPPEAGAVELVDVVVDERPVGVDAPVVGAVRGVGEGLGLADDVDDVEAEGPHAVGAPEVDDLGGPGAHLGVVPVEIGLGGVVQVQVVLAGQGPSVRVDGAEGRPGGPAELAHPVGGQVRGRRPVGAGGADVEVVAVALLAGQGAAEPLVLGGDVVEDHVEHGADAVGPQGRGELVEVLHGAHGGVHGAVVGDVVAVVVPGRGVEGVEPDVVHAEGGDVGDFVDDAAQIPHAVAVGVSEGLGIDLIDDGVVEGHAVCSRGLCLRRRPQCPATCVHK